MARRHTHTHTDTRVNVITTGPVWSVSLSLGLAGCAGPRQLLYYSSRQGSLAEAPLYKVQYKWTVGSPRDLAGKSLAELKPNQPFMAAHASGTTHRVQCIWTYKPAHTPTCFATARLLQVGGRYFFGTCAPKFMKFNSQFDNLSYWWSSQKPQQNKSQDMTKLR